MAGKQKGPEHEAEDVETRKAPHPESVSDVTVKCLDCGSTMRVRAFRQRTNPTVKAIYAWTTSVEKGLPLGDVPEE